MFELRWHLPVWKWELAQHIASQKQPDDISPDVGMWLFEGPLRFLRDGRAMVPEHVDVPTLSKRETYLSAPGGRHRPTTSDLRPGQAWLFNGFRDAYYLDVFSSLAKGLACQSANPDDWSQFHYSPLEQGTAVLVHPDGADLLLRVSSQLDWALRIPNGEFLMAARRYCDSFASSTMRYAPALIHLWHASRLREYIEREGWGR